MVRGVKAALIRELGSPPEVVDAPEPDGDEILDVVAAPLNPIDIAVGMGRHHAGAPPLPYVPGTEGVARRGDGSLVWLFSGGLGLSRNGAIGERVVVGEAIAVAVPEGADPAVAGALGIAGLAGWLPVAWRAPIEPGDTVLVLGATGTVGLVAVQAAKLLGAARVVAAGRDPDRLARAEQLGADGIVRLDEAGDLAAAFRDAFAGQGPSYVFDPLWGEPGAAAVEAAAPRARIVQLGQSAGATATLTSAAVRFKMLSIIGHTNFAVPADELSSHYRRLVELAIEGDVAVDVEHVPLDEVADAWQRQAEGSADRKLVVVL
jgi:NADPH:quinone reductase